MITRAQNQGRGSEAGSRVEETSLPCMPYNGPFGVWKAVSILAVLALLGLWAAVMRRR